MKIIPQVAHTMQTVLTETANQLAEETGLCKRQRKLNGASFAQTLVFGWLSNPDATIEELAQTATAIGVGITPEAVFQRFTEDASQFLKRMLDASIEQVISANPVAIEVLRRFCGVVNKGAIRISLRLILRPPPSSPLTGEGRVGSPLHEVERGRG